mgnify:CR=1 FL=1
MKKILLTLLSFLIISFSFSQKSTIQDHSRNLKLNSVKVVEFLNKNLKLDPKQKAVVMNAYGEYAANMMKAQEKTKMIDKVTQIGEQVKGDMRAKKDLNKHALRFAAKRDKMINDCLKKKQAKLYTNLVRGIHPLTLDIKERKK